MSEDEELHPLSPAELAERVRAATQRARASGALVPLDTRVRLLPDAGIDFLVRVSANVARKQAAAPDGDGAGRASARDPFTPPYETDLHVGDISETHAALLNKYNVLDDHVLLVTREWAEQTEMLDATDFEALLLGLAGMDGLAFYNGGADAGASQPHKHLQIVPLPLAPAGPALPFAEFIERAGMADGIGHSSELPFRHAIAPIPTEWFDDPVRHAPQALALAGRLWESLGYTPRSGHQPVPYNLLATRRWMWLVPRGRERWAGLGVNALGYAGALLVPDEDAFERLREIGPMQLLRATAEPRSADSAKGSRRRAH